MIFFRIGKEQNLFEKEKYRVRSNWAQVFFFAITMKLRIIFLYRVIVGYKHDTKVIKIF